MPTSLMQTHLLCIMLLESWYVQRSVFQSSQKISKCLIIALFDSKPEASTFRKGLLETSKVMFIVSTPYGA